MLLPSPPSRRPRHTSLPVATIINNDGGERKRRTRGERGKPLCCCRHAGGLAVGGAAATSSPPAKAHRRPWRVVAVWVAAGGSELAQGVAGVARRCHKRHRTSGRQEVTLRSPFFCRRHCRGFWLMGMALLLPEPPPVLPLLVSLKSKSLWLRRKWVGAERKGSVDAFGL
ncbi:hypothetical protein Ahy_B03g067995 [Arachis hypogaea]|uniref:Uncharacterized protein n=1 Tax=Arachis hypogaea TaxID=3818 RepID=A0A445A8F5_ARAHY|nr:hypothetical protein Ahy_B03g067995 [Arachis hypogaea]